MCQKQAFRQNTSLCLSQTHRHRAVVACTVLTYRFSKRTKAWDLREARTTVAALRRWSFEVKRRLRVDITAWTTIKARHSSAILPKSTPNP